MSGWWGEVGYYVCGCMKWVEVPEWSAEEAYVREQSEKGEEVCCPVCRELDPKDRPVIGV